MTGAGADSKGGLALLAVLAWGAGLAVAFSILPFPPRLAGLSAHIYWYLGRSAGFVAYWLLFSSVALGLAISSRFFDGLLGRPWVFELHKFLSVFVLIVMAFHALIMLPDPYADFKLRELLVPFQSHYRGTAVALGILVLYGSAIISASFYLKGLLGQKGWRLLHYLSFLLFVGALAHGVWAGTDSGKTIVQVSYLASGTVVLFLTLFRVLATRAARRKPRPKEGHAGAKPEGAVSSPAGDGSGSPERMGPAVGQPS
jgi:predicted ferric reductase